MIKALANPSDNETVKQELITEGRVLRNSRDIIFTCKSLCSQVFEVFVNVSYKSILLKHFVLKCRNLKENAF